MTIHVDQVEELACLADLINVLDDRRRILLLHGGSGSGKTAFLNEAFNIYENLTPVGWSDLRFRSDPIELMDDLAGQLAVQGVDLKKYYDALSVDGQPIHVAVNNSRLKASPIDVSIEKSAREDKIRRLLTNMMDDLDRWAGPPRRLILLDNYQDMPPTLAQWLDGTFLPRIAYNRSTICVVAGSRIPDSFGPPVRQRAANLALKSLEEGDVEEWLTAAGLECSEREVSFLWEGSRGEPGFLAVFVANMTSKRVDQE